MPVFIASSLILTTLIETQNPVLPFLNLDAFWISSVAIAAIFLLGGCLKRLNGAIWHDGFACASLWAWYGYWKPLFSEGSPQFSVFPVYFALLAAWMLFGFINRSPRFDWESQETFRYFETYLSRATPCALAALVLICLALPEHYLSFPLAMTFFVIRSAFQRCIEIIDRA